MNKVELAAVIADRLKLLRKDVENMLESFAEVVTEELQKGNEVHLAGFGAFSARSRKGRIGVNPRKPEEKITIPSVVVPKFKAGKGLKDSLKGRRTSLNDTGKAAKPEASPAAPAVQQ